MLLQKTKCHSYQIMQLQNPAEILRTENSYCRSKMWLLEPCAKDWVESFLFFAMALQDKVEKPDVGK